MAKPRTRTKPRPVTLLSGERITWHMIDSAYHEQAEGKAYSKARMRRDLNKKRAAFDSLAEAVGHMRSGKSYYRTAQLLGHSRDVVKDWVDGKRMPRDISLEMHAFRQRRRKPVRVNRTKKHEIGYFLGTSTADRLQQRATHGNVRFVVSTTNKAIADSVSSSVEGAFGVKVRTVTSRRAKRAKKPSHEVIIDSANLSKLVTRSTRTGKNAVDFLPDHPTARLGFTRAMFDLGKTWVSGRPGRKAILFWHEDPKVRAAVSQTLREHDIEHEISTHRGKASIKIAPEHTARFVNAIGFRDSSKHNRLQK